MNPILFTTVTLALLVIRIGFSLAFAMHDGDATNYFTHALYWADLGCLSTSPDCAFSWGGNQIPGHVSFMTLILMILGVEGRTIDQPPMDIIVIQNVLVVLSCAYLAKAAQDTWQNTKLTLALYVLTVLSPLVLPWGRTVLTEALTLALTIWVIAELLQVLRTKGYPATGPLLRLSIGLCLCVLWRVDMIVLSPVAGILVWRHATMKAALHLAAITTLLTGLAVGAWLAHGFQTGAKSMPTVNVPKHSLTYGTWATSWIRSQNDLSNSAWQVQMRHYSQVTYPDHAWVDEEDRKIVEELHTRLRQLSDDETVPEELQQAFVELRALQLKKRSVFERFVTIPAYRTLWLWLDPYNDIFWPLPILTEAEKASILANGPSVVLTEPTLGIVANLGARGMLLAYRIAVIALFFWLFFRAQSHKDPIVSALVLGALLFALFRSTFFTQLAGTETRYIIESYQFMEVAILFMLFQTGRRKHLTSSP